MIKSVIALDPGETTGWFFKQYNEDGTFIMEGGTVGSYHAAVFELLSRLRPDVVILETFHLYPGKAKSLSWNSFYPCEVIGVIKLWVQFQRIQGVKVEEVKQAPPVKKYAGGLQEDWVHFQKFDLNEPVTEHVKDAYLHLKYWERNSSKGK